MRLNLSDFDSVRNFSKEFHDRYTKLNILINNAGIIGAPGLLDSEGHDLILKTNHLGHFLLTVLLMDLIVETPESRVINVSSTLHKAIKSPVNFDDAYNGKYSNIVGTYGLSKYGNVLFSIGLQKRFDNAGV